MAKPRVLIVGGGPGGMAAAVAAAEGNASVTLLDQNPALGGQIWRGGGPTAPSPVAQSWFDRLRRLAIDVHPRTTVFAAYRPGELHADQRGIAKTFTYDRLILAPGGRERFLPFPGWTLPGVVGAGGLQALVKSGMPISGQRVVIAGSGPLLLAVADYLLHAGARVAAILEQASWQRLAAFGLGLLRWPGKLWRAMRLRLAAWRIPYLTDAWVVEACGSERIRKVKARTARGFREWECDWLACGFGLVGNLECPSLVGCRVVQGAVQVDEHLMTSIPHVYCVGEPLGIGGVDCALIEGQMAGYAAAGQLDQARRLMPERKRWRRFAARLEAAFTLRPEVRQLAQEPTILCRCEDVTLGQLKDHENWRSAKLQTRCGMGPCQGRVCGPAVEAIFGWRHESIRPPILPVCVDSLLASTQTEGVQHALAGSDARDHNALSN